MHLASELGDPTSELLARELSEQIPSDLLNLVVVGQFKRGKSALVNALLGADLMPTGALPLTGLATVIRDGGAAAVEVRTREARQARAIAPADIRLFVTEEHNPHNVLGVERVDVVWPSERLRGIALFDTPGIGSLHRHNTAAARATLPRADAAILVVGPDPPIGLEELEYAREVAASSEKLFVVLNKSDLAGESLPELLEFTRRAVADALSIDVDVLPVSAKRARAAQQTGEEDAEFARLAAGLRNFVEGSGRATRAKSFRRRALRVAERLDTFAALRISVWQMPAEQRRRRRQLLLDALQTIDDRARLLQLALDDDFAQLQMRLRDLFDRLHDRDLADFRSTSMRFAALSTQSERDSLFAETIAGVVARWRAEALAQANGELEVFAQKYVRLARDIERAVWTAGLEAAQLDAVDLLTADIWFAPANLRLVGALVPTTGLELVFRTFADLLPGTLRRAVLSVRYRRLLERELDAVRGKMRYGMACELEPWHRRVRDAIQTSMNDARSTVLAAFDESPDAAGETEASRSVGDARQRLRAIRACIENGTAAA
ncbi:MAG TPA: dynamin family protein [Candidatus Acidoferrales bacterium]|nr:dynamin family protein [Candidatus Acidoferrales bacterium]